jgi:group I intron endonuclease
MLYNKFNTVAFKAAFNPFMAQSLLSIIFMFLFTIFLVDYYISGGLSQATRLSNQSLEILLSFAPVIIYSNADTDKSKILEDNKDKAGVYLWTHKESGKKYVGSSVHLTNRLSKYYSKKHLEKNKSYINNAILLHGYSSFSLSILENINITNFSKNKARNIILEREQYYIDSLLPEYNILKIAGSSLGALHTEQTKTKISEALKGENHPFFGKTHTEETLAKMSGENNHFHGKSHTPEAKAKMSVAKTGENHPMYGRTGEDSPRFGKIHSAESLKRMSEAKLGILKTEEHKAKISKSMCKKVFVYTSTTPTVLSYEIESYSEAAKHFCCSVMTISKYVKSGKIFQEKWILTLSKK